MKTLQQSPTDPAFVQNPYPFYDRARDQGDLFWWAEYEMPAAAGHATVHALLRHPDLGREMPEDLRAPIPPELQPFYDVEAHSMLELEPPRHTRLRRLVLHAFTSRRIKELAPEIEALCHDLIDGFPSEPFDLLEAYAQKVPVIVIARLLGVPESMADQLLIWSNAMVTMYQARRTKADEAAAVHATTEFVDFIRTHAEAVRHQPDDTLISHLLRAEEDGERLTMDELITTCILLLNAGHEATVHTLGNGVKAYLETGPSPITDDAVEEVLRYDPPLHLFTRIAQKDVTLYDHDFKRGDQVACLLAAANRDPAAYPNPDMFDPTRPAGKTASFGAGIHFCIGAPLARLELKIALDVLFTRCPTLQLADTPRYANLYHFHGLERLFVRA
jgi:cytochrome P450